MIWAGLGLGGVGFHCYLLAVTGIFYTRYYCIKLALVATMCQCLPLPMIEARHLVG